MNNVVEKIGDHYFKKITEKINSGENKLEYFMNITKIEDFYNIDIECYNEYSKNYIVKWYKDISLDELIEIIDGKSNIAKRIVNYFKYEEGPIYDSRYEMEIESIKKKYNIRNNYIGKSSWISLQK